MKLVVLLFFAYSSLIYSQNDTKYRALPLSELDSLIKNAYEQEEMEHYLLLTQIARRKAKGILELTDVQYRLFTSYLSYYYESKGDYDKAIGIYDSYRQEIENLDDSQKKWEIVSEVHNTIATINMYRGDYREAMFALSSAQRIQNKYIKEKDELFAIILNNLAYVHSRMGNLEFALSAQIQAKKFMEQKGGEKHSQYPTVLNNLGSTNNKLGKYKTAEKLFLRAIEINEERQDTLHKHYIACLNNLAESYILQEQYNKALGVYIRARNLREKVVGKMNPLYATATGNLGKAYYSLESYDKALPLYQQAIEIREQLELTDQAHYFISILELVKLYRATGAYQDSWKQIQKLLKLTTKQPLSLDISQAWADQIGSVDFISNIHLEYTITVLNAAYLNLEVDNSIGDQIDKKKLLSNLAAQLLDRARATILGEKDKLRILSQSKEWLIKRLANLDIVIDREKAFEATDNNKSVLLLESTKSQARYKIGELPDSLIQQEHKLEKKQSQFKAALLEERTEEEKDSIRNELNSLHQNIITFEEHIKQHYPKYYQLKYQYNKADVKAIQKLLNEHTIMMEYVITGSVVHIFGVTKNDVEWIKVKIKEKELKDRIKTLHQALSNYKAVIQQKKQVHLDYMEQAYWFYKNLVEPIVASKKTIQKMIIVTDGEIGHLPFESFLVESSEQEKHRDYQELHYLVKDYDISYNYSATLWKENIEMPMPQNNGQILGVAANYNIQMDSNTSVMRLPSNTKLRDNLIALPAAQEEVKVLKDRYKGTFLFDTLASERVVKEKISQFSILHFATHGILDSKRYLLSSLVLTEDGNKEENNFWQAHEISKSKLNANLVVLSACETGFGRFETGNGIASLARSFMYAGASSIVVSLWQVNDQATAEIMKRFYNNLSNGMPKDRALRKAKLEYMSIAEGVASHPAFWSPFIMIGNTTPVEIAQKDNKIWGILGGGACLLLLLVGIGYKVRRKDKL